MTDGEDTNGDMSPTKKKINGSNGVMVYSLLSWFKLSINLDFISIFSIILNFILNVNRDPGYMKGEI